MSQTAVSEQQQVVRGCVYALIAVVLWSGNFIIARGLHQRITPVSLSFLRWMVATVILFPIAYSQLKKEWRELLPYLRYLCLTALTGVTIFNTLVYVAGRFTTAINLSLLGTTAAPVFVFIIAATFRLQTLSRFQYTGMLLCLAGILLLISGGKWEHLSQFRFTAGDLWILAAALSFAVYTLLVRNKPPQISSIVFLFAIFFLGTIFLIPPFLLDRYVSTPIVIDTTIAGAVLYLGIAASVMAFLLWNLSIRSIGPAKTSLFGNLIPVFSSIEAAYLLQESLSPVSVLSFVIILTGILIANFTLLRALVKR